MKNKLVRQKNKNRSNRSVFVTKMDGSHEFIVTNLNTTSHFYILIVINKRGPQHASRSNPGSAFGLIIWVCDKPLVIGFFIDELSLPPYKVLNPMSQKLAYRNFLLIRASFQM